LIYADVICEFIDEPVFGSLITKDQMIIRPNEIDKKKIFK